MASRAEAGAASGTTPGSGARRARSAVGLGEATRRALSDAYYHSWRLLPANVVWAVVAFGLLVAILVTPVALLLLPVLALPTAGIFRVTTRIVRGEVVSFWDAADAWRTDVRATLGIGAAIVAVAAVLGSNVMTGLASGSPIGWAIATLAAWGLVALWLLAWTLWPILLDPARAVQPARERARLATVLVLAHPIRIGVLGVALAAFLAVSAVAIVALVTISVSIAALVATRLVLPAADRLEASLGGRAADASVGPKGETSAVSSTR